MEEKSKDMEIEIVCEGIEEDAVIVAYWCCRGAVAPFRWSW